MGEGSSLINVGELAKPATVLIQKISNAVGGVCKPFQIKRVAVAEAEAAITQAKAEIEVTDLHRRAMYRFFDEQAKRQANMEAIAAKALPGVKADARPEQVEDDWIANFFDKCRITSDEQMQHLWAKVLAGEANVPGTFSKRTVNFVGSLDKEDAVLFSRLCGFAWSIGQTVPLVFDHNHALYAGGGITFGALNHLDDIGLITFQSITTFKHTGLQKRGRVLYHGDQMILEFADEEDNDLPLGHVVFTKTGLELAHISAAGPVEGFKEYVLEKWINEGVVISSPYPRATEGIG
jgi:hypothetical protein